MFNSKTNVAVIVMTTLLIASGNAYSQGKTAASKGSVLLKAPVKKATKKTVKLKLEIPLNDSGSTVLKPIRIPGTIVPGIAIKWTW